MLSIYVFLIKRKIIFLTFYVVILLGNAVIDCTYYERCTMIGQTLNLTCVVPAKSDKLNIAWSKSRGNKNNEISTFLEKHIDHSKNYDVALKDNSYILTIRNTTVDDAWNYTYEIRHDKMFSRTTFRVVVAGSIFFSQM